MDKSGKTKIAILSLIIISIVGVSVFAVFVVAGTHNSHADLEPEWSTPGVTNNYTVEIFNDGGDFIDEVRIMQNPHYTNFSCDEKTDWTLIFVEDFPDPEGIINMCWYFTDDNHAIPDNSSEIFYFEATAPQKNPKECSLTWKFETRDIEDFWRFIYDTTSIDSEAPETIKEYGLPFHSNGTYDWISTATPITLTATDMSVDCGIGVNKTYWRNTLIDIPDVDCIAACDFDGDQFGADDYTEVDGDTVTFYKWEESCHLIEFYATDLLGNEEEINRQCVLVDNTLPTIGATRGNPKIPCEEGEGCDWWISVTPITLTCTDQDPHPSRVKSIEYRWKLDGQWPQSNPNGDWILYTDPIIFEEDSVHDLEYRCTDNVDNVKVGPGEIYRVDSTPPNITKEMFGFYLGDCPPQNQSDECYVSDDGTSGVTITVEDPDPTGMGCNVGGIECRYELWWDGQMIDDGNFSDYKEIIFTEDSTHTLKIWCEDALGNAVYDEEEFLVDSTPPETIKEIGEPQKVDPDCVDWCQGNLECMHQYCTWWISTDTPITLNATDEKVGVNKTLYLNVLAEDYGLGEDPCWNPEQFCQPMFLTPPTECVFEGEALCDEDWSNWDSWEECVEDWIFFDCFDGDADFRWQVYDGSFQKPEESCHILEYYSIDKLGNVEDAQVNCFFVDNTPPESIKEVGFPRIACEGPENGGQGNNHVANVGDEIDEIFFPEGPATGVGVAFDGEFLYYTYISTTDLYKIRPDGTGHEVIPTSGVSETGLGALSYDAGRDKLWAGTKGCDGAGGGPVYLIDKTTGVATYMFTVPSQYTPICLDDGIAYDAADDSIWYSDDVNSKMVHMDTDGTFLGEVDLCNNVDSRLCNRNSGIAIGGDNFYLGTDGGEETLRVDKDTLTLLDEFVNTNFRIEDMECDPDTYSPVEVMWIRDAYDGSVRAYEIEPGTCGLGGEPPQDRHCWFVTQETPISLECEDQEPHPVEQETVWWKFSLWEDGFEGEANYSEWYNESYTGFPIDIYFEEDSWHDLEYYCVDHLGNSEEINVQYYIVDSQPPVINKTVVGPSYGNCPPEEGEVCFIDGMTNISVDVYDPEPHPVGDITCKWSYDVYEGDSWKGSEVSEGTVEPPFVIHFPEESRHELTITCWDALGNEVKDYETFYVDKSGPERDKEYGEPYFSDDGVEWINMLTPIYANLMDSAPHPSGVASAEYRVTLVDDESCLDSRACQNTDGNGNFLPAELYDVMAVDYNRDVVICHNDHGSGYFTNLILPPDGAYNGHIRYNNEPDHLGDHYGECTGEEEGFVGFLEPDKVVICHNDHGSGKFVNMILPSNGAYNGHIAHNNTPMHLGDHYGPCTVEQFNFTIPEESCHLIEIEIVDNVDKSSMRKQCVFVDNTPPVPNKTVENPKTRWDGNDSIFYTNETAHCWDGTGNEIECWKVTLDTPINLECTDPEPHPVDHEYVCFNVEVDAEDKTEEYCDEFHYSGTMNDGFCCLEQEIEEFHFTEETEHNLKFYCVDALGNSNKENLDEEKFKVLGHLFEIQINKKWNLISVPFALIDPDVEEVFKEIEENVESVWTYDGETAHWHVYRPGEDLTNDLDEVETGLGYWVSAYEDDTLVVGGSLYSPGPVTPPNRELVEGWNLIGYYGAEDEEVYNYPDGDGKNAYCALYSLRNLDGGLLKPTKWSGLLTYWEPDNPEQWKELGWCQEMDPGAGYWIGMEAEGSYKPQTVCDDSILNLICEIT